jgi:iron complex transport system substrate-binding protein
VRIASLVPSATESLFALGLGASVLGVTHECDFPPEAAARPHLTRTVVPDGLSTAEIDRAVRERTERGQALYELDADRLAELAPDLVVTQTVCEVCAVSFDDVRAVAVKLPSAPRVISMDPATLGEVLDSVRALGAAAGADEAAGELLDAAAGRLDGVRDAVAGARRPRVACLEWLDPVYVGGHWVPQMVELAGGEDVLGRPGERSRAVAWEEVVAAESEVVVAMPCGYGTDGARGEALSHRAALARLGEPARTVAVDASSYFSRPGPRLIDGVELLGHLLHPERVPAPPPGRFAPVELGRAESLQA